MFRLEVFLCSDSLPSLQTALTHFVFYGVWILANPYSFDIKGPMFMAAQRLALGALQHSGIFLNLKFLWYFGAQCITHGAQVGVSFKVLVFCWKLGITHCTENRHLRTTPVSVAKSPWYCTVLVST